MVNASRMGWPDRAACTLDRWMDTRLWVIGFTAFGVWTVFVGAGLVTRWLHPAFAATVLVPLVAFLWLRLRDGWRSRPWLPDRLSTGR